MGKIPVRHSAELNAKVALKDLKEVKMVDEFAGQDLVHPKQISQWKCQVRVEARELFGTARDRRDQAHETV